MSRTEGSDKKRFYLYTATIAAALVAWALIYVSLSSPAASIDGRVLDAYTNKPVQGAVVSTNSTETETAENGRFRIRTSEDEIEVRVEKENYEKAETFLKAGLKDDEKARIKLRPTSLTGHVLDTMDGQPVKGATIRGAGLEATTDKAGRYKLGKVPEDLVVEVIGPTSQYEVLKTEISRVTEHNFRLSPTAEEVVNRIGDLTIEGDYDGLYELVHPDIKKVLSKPRFVRFNEDLDRKREESGSILTGIEVTSLKTVNRWYNSSTKLRYDGVVQTRIVLVYLDTNRLRQSKATIHLMKVDGKWRYFVTSNDVRKAQDA
ncbi:MAG: carboxypeptidase regulatory-like domain-containing protein [Terriglobia bacterium]